ncbi:nicotinate-nucleotide adenylyltransferase [Bacillus sp. C1-1]|nr:nicotinate-nucleotide adenylyltransferase [Bacillus sp. C1-1]
MRRIGLFGGTFDPPHHGHLLIAQEAQLQLGLDEVWFIPVSSPPHKVRTELTSGANRLALTKAAVNGQPAFKVLDLEIERKGKSYTYDTVRELRELYPQAQFYFLIGADMVEQLDHWYNISELKNMVTFAAFDRPGSHIDDATEVTRIPFPQIDISSSFIRERVRAKMPIRYFVPELVRKFIEEQSLYDGNTNRSMEHRSSSFTRETF